MSKETLLLKAKEARKFSYSPYSHFAVGAAVETKDGQIFLGANVENSSYPFISLWPSRFYPIIN